jgi:hypothetical protein
VRIRREKALSAACLPAPKTRLEEEISELRNFVTVFKDGRENYRTKMAATRRDLVGVVGAPSGGIELVLCKFLFQ